MTLDSIKGQNIIVSWSGGKDSTASIFLLLQHGIKPERIYCVDMRYDENTPAILPEHYEFIISTAERFRSFGLTVDFIKSKKSAFQLATTPRIRGGASRKNTRNDIVC